MKNGFKFLAAAAVFGAVSLTGVSANAATATTSILVTAAVAQACIVVATPLAFGIYDPTAATANDNTAAITVTCTFGTPYTVSLNAGTGTGATTTVRKMTFGTEVLNYALYSNAGRTTNWGNSAGVDTVGSTATGLPQIHTVYGRIPALQTIPTGAYIDTVGVTVTY